MDEWCTRQHGNSGLTDKCRSSDLSLSDCQAKVIEFLQQNGVQKGKCPLAGNSVWADKEFLKKDMPELAAFLNYRILDVSSIKLCNIAFNQGNMDRVPPKKEGKHRALEDIEESIKELKW
mmetsp:Transcript_99061/g.213855  ORF Transcript_99061/g.213855 Transcript_99061/m.213855 type:complete len:120 (-) Transcript_99061:101-460(-)